MIDLAALALEARGRLAAFLVERERAAELSLALRPRPEDYARLFRPALAEVAAQAYDRLWAGGMRIEARPQDSDLLIKLVPAEQIFPGSPVIRAFPGAWVELGPQLLPGPIWGVWKFVVAGSMTGMAYDGLCRLDERWIWCPRPYVLLERLPTG